MSAPLPPWALTPARAIALLQAGGPAPVLPEPGPPELMVEAAEAMTGPDWFEHQQAAISALGPAGRGSASGPWLNKEQRLRARRIASGR